VGHIASNENFTFPIEWDSSSNVINVLLAHPDPVPFAFAFALYSAPPTDEKKSGGWGIGSALSAVTSALGYYREGWEPAVPGIDAPLYQYPKLDVAEFSYPVSSPVSSPSPTHAYPSPPPAVSSEVSFSVEEPEFVPVHVVARAEMVRQDIIDVEVDTPLQQSVWEWGERILK
jgi:hypothetical protein